MELIKVTTEGYDRYEQLLLRRDQLRKEAYKLEQAYTREFGQEIIDLFRVQISCIRLKKEIAYCQAFANRGERIDREEMEQFLAKEMADFNAHLKEMIRENEALKERQLVSAEDYKKIKKIYRRLAKQLHPDINPKTEQIPELQQIWRKIQAAYIGNNLEELEEADLLVQMALKKLELGSCDIEIPDISGKITKLEEEIYDIQMNNPYQYKYLLEDEAAVLEKHEEYKKERAEYQDYKQQLQDYYDQLISEGGVNFIWRMN